MRALLQDLHYGIRMLARSPGFTAIAVLMLALGIGANTAIFSLIDAVLLRSLPVHDPAQLVVLRWSAHKRPHPLSSSSYGDCESSGNNPSGCSLSLPLFKGIRQQTNVFSGIAAFAGPAAVALSGNGAARIAQAEIVSGDYFSTLGVGTILGRPLAPADDSPSASPALVLDYGTWRSQFGGSTSVVGRVVGLNGVPFTIAGIAEPGFTSLTPGKRQDFWIPISVTPRLKIPWMARIDDPGDWWLAMIARLKPGVPVSEAQAAVSLQFRNEVLRGAKPRLHAADDPKITLLPAQEALKGERGDYLKILYPLLFAVGLILLIACANVAGLLLARGAARRKEMAVRLAIGAKSSRLVRQLMTESVMLSFLGGALGVIFAYWGVHAMMALLTRPGGEAFAFTVSPDWRVLAFTLSVAMLTGILFGAAPAIAGTRVELTPALKENASAARPAETVRSRIRAGSALAAAQVALSVVVLLGAGLLVRTLQNLHNINPGFDTRNVLLFGVNPSQAGYKDTDTPKFYRELKSRLAAIPGVLSVSYSSDALLNGGLWTSDVYVEGQPQKTTEVDMLAVGPDFFPTLRIPLLAGRVLASNDSEQTTSIPVVVNAAFVHRYFAKQNPLGRRITQRDDSGKVTKTWEVAGVVGDAKYVSLDRAVQPTVYVPLASGEASFELRTALDPSALIPTVRQIAKRLDSNVPLFRIETQRESIEGLLTEQRVIARLSSFFGVLALLLASIGLYGLLSYEVVRRTREIGIRMALGAERRDVLRRIGVQGLRVTIVGLVAGLIGGFGLTRFLSSLLFGVKPHDELTFAIVSLILLAVALLASYVPARRATKVDPMVALRYE